MKTSRLARKLTTSPCASVSWRRAMVYYEVTNLRRGVDGATACAARATATPHRSEAACCAPAARRRMRILTSPRGVPSDSAGDEVWLAVRCRPHTNLNQIPGGTSPPVPVALRTRCMDPWRPRDAAVRAALAAAECMPSVKRAESGRGWTRGRYVLALLLKVFRGRSGWDIARDLRAWVRHIERDLGLRGRLKFRRAPWQAP